MAETKNGTAGNVKLFIIIGLIFVALMAGFFFVQAPEVLPESAPETETQQPEVVAGQTAEQPAANAAAETTTTSTETPPAAAAPASSSAAKIDVSAALSDRIIGDTSAPVRISEHSSLTCSHCGDFHRNVFDKFKKDFIDTKKAYINFSDFPLNQPALDASMIARCLPEGKYFGYLSMLFKTQADWAYDQNYKDYLKSTSAKEGLSDAMFEACLASKELAEGIKNRMKGSSQQWGISATPTFVINNKTVISGASSYEDFKKIVEEETARINEANKAAAAKIETSAPAPAAPSASDTVDSATGDTATKAVEAIKEAVVPETETQTAPAEATATAAAPEPDTTLKSAE